MQNEVIQIITIYNKNETSFTHNGLGILNPTSAEVTEELNGKFELTLTCYAVNNVRIWEYLEDDYIIKAHTPRGFQLFRIYNVVKRINNQVTVNARHIFYDLLYNDVANTTLTGVTADTALKALLANATTPTSFTASSNITTTADIAILDTNFVTAVFDDSDKITGIISTYGGEILRDNFDIKLQPSIGTDNGFTIAYRKNLTGLDYTINSEDIVTRIKPIARNKNDTPLYLPEVYIDSPNIGLYFMPKVAIVEFMDIRVGSGYTTTTAYEEMRRRANEMYTIAS